MEQSIKNIETLFHQKGGEFISPSFDITQKLKGIKAYAFDWDGVFNEGEKGGEKHSGFSEVDSMGTNMLRFSHYLANGEMPVSIILTGADNQAAYDFAKREHFDGVYFKIADKRQALLHLEEKHGIKPSQVAFFFDDVLDLSVAKIAGLRTFINSKAKVLFTEYVKSNKLVDYKTVYSGGEHGVREACELLIGLHGNFDSVMENRIAFSEKYQQYLNLRNQQGTVFFTTYSNQEIIEHHIA